MKRLIAAALVTLLIAGCANNPFKSTKLPEDEVFELPPPEDEAQPVEVTVVTDVVQEPLIQELGPEEQAAVMAQIALEQTPGYSREPDAPLQATGPPQVFWMTPNTGYRPRYTHKEVGDYAEQIAMNLMEKARWVNSNSRIAVASFVELDRTLRNPSILGNQLSESLMTEMQAYGLPVVDIKTNREIRVTETGDLVFSRHGWGMDKDDFDYVLSGTLIRNEKGVRVNARIISIRNRVVVASTKGFIPHFVVQSLSPQYVVADY